MAERELSLALRALNEWWAEAGLDLAEARAAAALQEGERKRPPPGPGKAEPLTPQALAARAGDLAALKAAVERFEGCALRTTARSTVFLEGPDHAAVMLVGERPGREEDAAGRPFVGRSGALLERMLGAIGLSREEHLLLANVVFWRPPGDRTPTQSEVALCLPFLERAIALVRPKALLLCGGLAAQTLLRTEEGPLRLRAREHTYQHTDGFSVHAMVMLHPAYLLRRPQEKRLAWADLLRLESRLDALGIARRPRL